MYLMLCTTSAHKCDSMGNTGHLYMSEAACLYRDGSFPLLEPLSAYMTHDIHSRQS